MARYPLTFTDTWTYNAGGGYWNLATYKNTNPYAVKVTKIELYLGTGRGTFSYGDYVYGVGNPINNWLQIYNFNNNSYIATSPKNENYGQTITKQVGSIYQAYDDLYYPNQSECALYTYTTFTTTWSDTVTVTVQPNQTILIKISGGGFKPGGNGVLCIDKYGVNGSTRQSYITVEPVNPNVTLTLKYNYAGAPSDKILSVPINNNTSLGSPSRTGYTFDGWYTASSGGNKVSDPYKVTKNTTLYAHWNIISYNIKYIANETEFATQSANYASQITLISNIPTREGYIFSSWNTDPPGISYAPGNTITMPATNITLYAQWMQAPPIWVYSTTDNQWHNAADPSDTQNYRPIYRYDEANSQWVNDRNINIYNGEWKEVASNGGQ